MLDYGEGKGRRFISYGLEVSSLGVDRKVAWNKEKPWCAEFGVSMVCVSGNTSTWAWRYTGRMGLEQKCQDLRFLQGSDAWDLHVLNKEMQLSPSTMLRVRS